MNSSNSLSDSVGYWDASAGRIIFHPTAGYQDEATVNYAAHQQVQDREVDNEAEQAQVAIEKLEAEIASIEGSSAELIQRIYRGRLASREQRLLSQAVEDEDSELALYENRDWGSCGDSNRAGEGDDDGRYQERKPRPMSPWEVALESEIVRIDAEQLEEEEAAAAAAVWVAGDLDDDDEFTDDEEQDEEAARVHDAAEEAQLAVQTMQAEMAEMAERATAIIATARTEATQLKADAVAAARAEADGLRADAEAAANASKAKAEVDRLAAEKAAEAARLAVDAVATGEQEQRCREDEEHTQKLQQHLQQHLQQQAADRLLIVELEAKLKAAQEKEQKLFVKAEEEAALLQQEQQEQQQRLLLAVAAVGQEQQQQRRLQEQKSRQQQAAELLAAAQVCWLYDNPTCDRYHKTTRGHCTEVHWW